MFYNKLINFINNTIFRTPDLKFFKNTDDISLKQKYFDYWNKKASKNYGFRKFFYGRKNSFNLNNVNFRFKSNKDFNLDEKIFNSLKVNGLFILEDALPKYEKDKVLECFNSLQENKRNSEFLNNPIEINRGKETKLVSVDINIKNFNCLRKYSDILTKKIYNKIVAPNVNLQYLKITEVFEKEFIKGETYLHTDRFLPHFKMFYTPWKIDEDEAPFEYALGSHIIDDNYRKFFINSKEFDETDNNSSLLYNKKVPITVPENTLYVAFTNGLHRRTEFKKKNSERCMMFFQYVKRYNKFNYLFNI